MVLAVLAAAGAAVFNLYDMTAKPNRDWDAEIDRIVAQHQEKRRQMASSPQTEPVEPVTLASAATVANADEAAASKDEEANVRDAVAEKKAQTAAQTSKKPGRRNARGGPQFVPAAFVNLPKFAAASAASALLRLR